MATEWWIPVLSFAGGSGVTLAVEYLRSLTARADRRQAALERREDREADRSTRERERRLQLEDEHRAGQREALTELQDKLSDFIRTAGEAQHADQMAWKQAGQPDHFPVSQLPDGISVELNTLQRRIQILAVRIDDEQIRDGVDALIGLVNDSLTVRKADRAWQVGSQAAKEFGNLNSRIGEELRLLAAQRIESKSLVHGPTSTLS
jgi:hypothetical protein